MSDPFDPSTLQRKKPAKKFEGGFASTVMGTAVFVAEMQRKVPLRTRILSILLVLVAGGIGGYAYLDLRAKAQRHEQLEAALLLPAGGGTAEVRRVLHEGLGDDDAIRAFAYLGAARDSAGLTLLIDGLARSADVQLAAATALAQLGTPAADAAKDPLATALATAEPVSRSSIAWGLVALGDPRGVEPVVEALASGQIQAVRAYEAKRLAEVLGRQGLLDRIRHTQAPVRQFAATWLGRPCGPDAVGPLTAALADAEQGVVLAASVSLARCGGLGDQAVSQVLTTQPALRAPLAAAFESEVGAPGLALLVATAPDDAQRADALNRLVASRDPRGGDALVAEINRQGAAATTEARILIGSALAELGDARAVQVLEPVVANGEREWAQRAIEALGAIGAPEAVSTTLMDVYGERTDVRYVTLLAMGNAGVCDDQATRLMVSATRDRAIEPAAIQALTRCNHPVARDAAEDGIARPRGATGEASAEEGNLRYASFDAVARLGMSDVSAQLLAMIESETEDPRMRTAAADALGLAGDDATLDRAAAIATNPAINSGIRAACVRALRWRVPASAVALLAGYVRGGGDDDRTISAALILAEHGDPQVAEEMRALLADERAQHAAAIVVALGGNPQGAAELAALMQRNTQVNEVVRERYTNGLGAFSLSPAQRARLNRRIDHLLALRQAGVGALWDELTRALAQGSAQPGGASARELRRAFVAELQSPDAATRHRAAEVLRSIGARGALLAERDRGGAGWQEADAALSER